ncbi:MAG: hypothetical protein J6H18_00255 [Lachnospiraceae bacterium]|nr:hypothetical protein [Lachnospiraceae bacterium]
MSKKTIEAYADILDRERPLIPGHLSLSRESRAAQFSPFAALTGYEELIEEGARLTEDRLILGEDAAEELNRSLQRLPEIIEGRIVVELVYFEKDPFKSGGHFLSYRGRILKYDPLEGWLKGEEGKKILFEQLQSLTTDPL